jgi:hypothetical protein
MTGKQKQCLECLEQTRLLGMGADRELKLMVERDALKQELAAALATISKRNAQLKAQSRELNAAWARAEKAERALVEKQT